MKTYRLFAAEGIPHYGTTDIEATDATAAITAAKALDIGRFAIDPDYDNGSCKRIVRIEDEAGRIIVSDIPLDNCHLFYGGNAARLLCDLAPELLKALQIIAAIPLYGEPLPEPMAELKEGLILSHEFDEADQTYTPCVDTESSHLEHAVETARAVLAKAKGGAQ